PPPPLRLTSRPAPFWPDVFVTHRVARRPYWVSATYHAGAIAFFYLLPALLLLTAPPAPREAAAARTITYYKLSEYLPEIRSAPAPAKAARQGQPKFAAQAIISVPREPNHLEQTIVAPNSRELLPEKIAPPKLAVLT